MVCTSQRQISSAVLAALITASCSVHALEAGTLPSYLDGAEGFLAGAVPPPGLYGLAYAARYRADRLNDGRGQALPIPGFKTSLDVVVTRLAWVTGQKAWGGDLVVHTLIPLLNVKLDLPGVSQSKSGLGDIVVGAGLGFHHSPQLHSVVALDVHLPTGRYDASDVANLGSNHTAVEPVYALTHVDAAGFNGDVRAGVTFHGRNAKTDYTTGTDVHLDYAAGWAVTPGWVLGVGGHYHQQLAQDRQGGSAVSDSKVRSAAIGPMLKYDSGRGWFLTLKWQQEFAVRNAPQGSGVFLKAVMPL